MVKNRLDQVKACNDREVSQYERSTSELIPILNTRIARLHQTGSPNHDCEPRHLIIMALKTELMINGIDGNSD